MDKRTITIYFRALCCIAFAAMTIFGPFAGWSKLTFIMCLSLTACFGIFTGTAIKDKKWVEEHGEPEEYEKQHLHRNREKEHNAPDRSTTVKPKKLKK